MDCVFRKEKIEHLEPEGEIKHPGQRIMGGLLLVRGRWEWSLVHRWKLKGGGSCSLVEEGGRRKMSLRQEEKMKKSMSNSLSLHGEMKSELTEIITDQWSSVRVVLPPRGQLAMPGDVLGCPKMGNVLLASGV